LRLGRYSLRPWASAPPCAIVIFGASGDLAKRKLIPANLRTRPGETPERKIVHRRLFGARPSAMSSSALDCKDAIEKIRPQQAGWIKRCGRAWRSASATRAATMTQPAITLIPRKSCKKLDAPVWQHGRHRLFYSLDAAQCFRAGCPLPGRNSTARIAINPRAGSALLSRSLFGRDLASARGLNELLHNISPKSRSFRIDHYLGKETVQNMMVMRFCQFGFRADLDYKYIDHVQITVSGNRSASASRGGYYDRSGATRDMVQNHMFQLMALNRDGAAGGAGCGEHSR